MIEMKKQEHNFLKVPLIIHILPDRYKILKKIERKIKNTIFSNEEIPFECEECPARHICKIRNKTVELFKCFGRQTVETACYGAFMRFLFSEEWNKI
jgi:hypothetical protein